jgi:Predicted membrane protein
MKILFPKLKKKGTAGLLLFTGALIFLFGMMLAEFTYVNYNMANNYISDLGNFTHPVPAIIFNASIITFGAMAVCAGLLLRTALDRGLAILIILAGAGGIGVGVFNEGTILPIHYISALTVFIGGCIAIYRSAKVLYTRPVSYIFLIMAGIVVFFMSIMIFNMVPGSHIHFGIGVGGMERMVVFPTIFWVLVTGIYLVAQAQINETGSARLEV